MPKGYLVVEMEVVDAALFDEYRIAAGPLLEQAGGRVVIGPGRRLAVEGEWSQPPFFLIEFESYEAAHAFYFSPRYRACLPMRLKAAPSRAFLVEGTASP